MKKLSIILFANENEYEQYADRVCEKLFALPESKKFCGAWGEIRFNDKEVIAAISSTISYFLLSDVEEVFFGCCEKDCENILEKISTQNCAVVKLSYRDI